MNNLKKWFSLVLTIYIDCAESIALNRIDNVLFNVMFRKCRYDMKGVISVIVPIYKVEKYLNRCIESIIYQTYKKLEIILVDDESPDNCGNICDMFAQKDNRIKVIHKKNGGLSDARNAGLEVANGEYIAFVDGDDFIHQKMYELLYNMIENSNADIGVCNFKKVKELEKMSDEECHFYKEKVLENNNQYLDLAFNEKTSVVFTVVWNKLYRKELFQKVRFPVGKVHEDEFTTYKVVHLSSKIAFFDMPLYYYTQRDGSIMSKKFGKNNLLILDAYHERLLYYSQRNMFDWYEKVLFMYRLYLMQFRKKIIESSPTDIIWLKKYQKWYKEHVIKNCNRIPVSIKQKLSYIFSAVMLKVYFRVRYIKSLTYR